jgi:thymidine phosphorylase
MTVSKRLSIDSSDFASVISDLTYNVHGITATAGGGQANAVQLVGTFNRVGIVASASDSVKLPVARESQTVKASSNGVITKLDALSVGIASWRLGSGRARKEDPIQFGAGVTLHAQLGDTVKAGDPLYTLHTDEPARFQLASETIENAYSIEAEAVVARKLILDRIS